MTTRHANHRRIAVIGAGPAGMTAAYQLAKGGASVEVHEASPWIGGMARTFTLWGQKVDLGPHRFFSNDKRVNALWLEVIGHDYEMVDRLTRIYYKGTFFYYPLRPLNALVGMGVRDATRCVGSYIKEKLAPSFHDRDVDTFETWVVRRFGRRLFEMFFKSYSEKLWGLPCDSLDADFAAQRIKRFSLGEAIKAAFGASGTRHKTLADQFAYPREGTGIVYERMAQRVRDLGGTIHLNSRIQRVTHEKGKVTGIESVDGSEKRFDDVISTMPLTSLVAGLGEAPAAIAHAVKQLKFRNTILVYLEVKATELFRDQWLYIHSPELRMGRVTNFRNWVPQVHGEAQTTVLAIEYWCYDDDAIWVTDDDDLVNLASREMRSTGLLGDAPVVAGHVERVRRCYPVYGLGYKDHVRVIAEYVKGFRGLMAIGRYGAFKYNNQDHSMLMGYLAAENILDDAGHDVWGINTDYDSYQEASKITGAGLEDSTRP